MGALFGCPVVERGGHCGACQWPTQQQRPFCKTTNLHTDPRCGAVTGTMLEIRQCKVCGIAA